MILQSRLSYKEVKHPWTDICCESCWNAKEERCECHCGGRFHGLGTARKSDLAEMAFSPSAAQKFWDYVKEKRCSWCNESLDGEPIMAWKTPHDGGWKVEGFEEKLWLFIVCPNCNYQWALWKLGVARNQEVS